MPYFYGDSSVGVQEMAYSHRLLYESRDQSVDLSGARVDSTNPHCPLIGEAQAAGRTHTATAASKSARPPWMRIAKAKAARCDGRGDCDEMQVLASLQAHFEHVELRFGSRIEVSRPSFPYR